MLQGSSIIFDIIPISTPHHKQNIEETLKVSQIYLSNKIGISQSYLSAVLKGKRGASAELIAGLYIHYREYLSWLLTGEGGITGKVKSKEVGVSEDIPLYNKVGDEDPEIAELLEGARKVLKSGNQIAYDALERNIRYFAHAIDMEKRLKKMESRLESFEKRLKKKEECPKRKIAVGEK
ncbi:MAG: helix-turn-helix transcriptional regulator [Desulfobacterales bacterium]|nr:helix-turn-helix transcriptional regulator [Desulfobacterales bacterium]MBL7207292.1 helix-turn-helix transcriptional regulator [Desulfobacterales bacterium]